ncbi:NACHT domain-containing protein [uncultured Microbacterium sp.]|uniref:NACHT domain-containing protein n=1 Tax=uncultured Microbacterium sp. TaxID=191216 RepID=UPI0028D8F023|nr:NACHT domain-containing protein [uncultured Microbacterium sp.]
MDFGMIGAVVEALSFGASLVIDSVARKNRRDAVRLYENAQSLDPDQLRSSIGALDMAGHMQGAVDAELVEAAVSAPQYRDLVQEVAFSALIGSRAGDEETASTSLRLYLRQELHSRGATEADADVFAAYFADALRGVCVAAISHLRDSDPQSLSQLQQVGLLQRIASILDNIEPHHRALVRAEDNEIRGRMDDFVREYRRLCADIHGYIRPPDFTTNRKVPMDRLYVAPQLRTHRHKASGPELDVSDFIAAINRTVVLGDPGGGKSTLSNFVALTLARDASARVPFHITLRDFAPHAEDHSVLSYIERELKPRYQVDPVEGALQDLFAAGRAMVIFDGLDELIDSTKRRDITRVVETFCFRYPLVPVLVTSRRVGYDLAQLDPEQFSSFIIDGFSEDEVETYVRKWFDAQLDFTPQQADAHAVDFYAQSESVPDLRSNPLMLALMCILFRGENYIPRNRPEVYERCAKLLFEKWDGHRGIETPLQARAHLDSAMKYLAFAFLQSEASETGIGEAQLVALLTDYLYPRAVETREDAQLAAQEFVEYCSGRAWVFTDAGTTEEGQSLYTFTHRTFLEYFAAVHLTRINDTPEKLSAMLLPRVAREEWDVVAQLAVQQADRLERGTERVLSSMLHERRRRTADNRGRVLAFVARCTSFAVVSPSLIREIAAACLSFGIDGVGQDGREFNPMTPWHELRSSATGQDAAIVASEIEHGIDAAFANESQIRVASWFLLNAIVRSVVRSRVGLSDGAEVWERTFLETGAKHARYLEHAELSGAVRGAVEVLALCGALSPTKAVEILQGKGESFGLAFYEEPSTFGIAGGGLSVTESMLLSFRRDWDTAPESFQHGVIAFAELFMEQFRRGDRSAVGVVRSGSVTRPTRHRAQPTPIVDAAVIAHLGRVELYSFNDRRRGRGVTDLRASWVQFASEKRGTFDRLLSSASDDVRAFAANWQEGGTHVFEDLAALERQTEHTEPYPVVDVGSIAISRRRRGV